MLRAQKSIPALVLFAVAFVALLCAAPAFAGEPAQSPAASPVAVAPASAPDACGLNLAYLASQPAQAETCAAVASKSEIPDFMTSHRLGYCHCGCVNQRVCRTSADCGGASCDQFISCC